MKNVETHNRRSRSGVTLTEVLMSLMIMGIGVTAVATLFPIAALRSAQATRLTNAAILKRNVEAQLRAQPNIIFDPDGDGDFIEHFRAPNSRRYIIDPVGVYTQQSGWFGNVGGTVFQTLPRWDGGLRVSTGLNPAVPAELLSLQLRAAAASRLGDGWDTVVDTFAEELVLSGSSVVGVKVPTDFDLSDLYDVDSLSYIANSGYDPELTRITVFNADEQFSEAFPLNEITDPQTCRWRAALGREFDFNNNGTIDDGEVGRVVIQTRRSSDFTWILTVRRGADGRTSGVDVVVMFNNGRFPEDEQVYTATFVRNSNQVGVAIPSTADPTIRRGGFVLDVENARWYRITQVNAAPTASGYTHFLEVETSISEANGEDQFIVNGSTNIAFNGTVDTNANGVSEDTNSNGGLDFGHAMFIPDVVEVFPLGSFPVPGEIIPRNF